jgi:IrrE N-terminal-like domain
VRRGFATEARRLALEVRAELGLSPYVPLDPGALAELYGIPVYPLEELAGWGCHDGTAAHFTVHRPDAFSAALVPVDAGLVIVENSAQSGSRRRASISHEMAHVLLEHPFRDRLLPPAGCPAGREAEEEADRLAGELLIPATAALAAARDGASDTQVARRYRVSLAFARMRMNRSGARKRAAYERAKRSRASA